MLRYAEPMFTERANAYQDFASLANGLPPVYVEKIQMTDASFLMPGIPTVHDRRSLAACRQELWRHHRQALSFAKIGEEGYM